MKYSANIHTLSPSVTLRLAAQAKEMARAGRDVISLSTGQPDFPTPAPIREAAAKAISAGKTGYTASSGIRELREAVASSYSRRRGLGWTPDQVVVSCGAKYGIAILVASAINPGDKVLIPRPYWVSYPEIVRAFGGVPVVPAEGITTDTLLGAASDGAVGVILNYPSNPSGYVPSSAEMSDLADAIAETDMWIISDDIYEDLTYLDSGTPHLLDFRPELKERVAVVSGVSKTYSMTGWRIGYCLCSDEWAGLAGVFQAHTTSNPCSISQWAALAAVEGRAEKERRKMFETLRGRRDMICSLLAEEKFLEYDKPDGAFYVFARIVSDSALDSAEFCSELLEEEGLAIIPGSSFGAEGFVRISFAAGEEDIREGLRRLGRFLHRRYD